MPSQIRGSVKVEKEEWERLHAKVAVLETALVACRRPPLIPILVLPTTSGYQPW